MPTLITVRRHFVVPALLDIANPDFARWYSHGVFWAVYGDYQGQGPYEDRYLIDNVQRNIRYGWYRTMQSEHLTASGFYLGMLHGGMIEPGTHVQRPEATIVRLMDSAFTSGYYAGRQEPRELSDAIFMRLLHMYALKHPLCQNLAYDLGVFVGCLSLKLLPLAVATV